MLKEQLMDLFKKTLSDLNETFRPIRNSKTTLSIRRYFKKIGSNSPFFPKKKRKSSIKPAQEIDATKAFFVLNKIKHQPIRPLQKNDAIDGKKSLAYVVWALGQAERAGLAQGMSIHDVSSLLYHACKIQLYPINISRIMFGNKKIIQTTEQKKAKTYLLTKDGQALFTKTFL